MPDEDAALISRRSDAGHAAVGVLTWDSETQEVVDKLTELGGNPQTHQVAKLTRTAISQRPIRKSAKTSRWLTGTPSEPPGESNAAGNLIKIITNEPKCAI
jgi:hypothetical protein